MPRKAKEEIDNKKDVKKVVKKETPKTVAKKTTVKKVAAKKTTTKKTTAKKTTTKKATTKKTTTKKATTKKTTTKKATTSSKVKKVSPKKSSTKSSSEKINIVEYYDLPYRYNQTVVKVLAQTPTTLFVYWDISDNDKQQYINTFGEFFFNNTKPVLIIENKTKNYKYEIDINDFANSWYLHVNDSNCDYQIELGRRPINNYVSIPNNYLYITTSNDIESPNDHILFDKLSKLVYFRNVKNNNITQKNIATLYSLRKIGKLYNIKDFYENLYPEEEFNFDKVDLKNPSSKYI